MKKLAILTLAIILVFSGCSKSEEATTTYVEETEEASGQSKTEQEVVEETEAEIVSNQEVDTSSTKYELTKKVTINDGMVSFYVPEDFEAYTPDAGELYRCHGNYIGQNGGEYYCSISIVAVVTNEDSMTKEDFPLFSEGNSIYNHGHNTVYEMLDESFEIDGHQGVLAKIRYPSGMNVYHEYFTYLESEDMLYDISFTLYYDVTLDSEEDYYEDVFQSEVLNTFTFDKQKEKEMNDAFDYTIEDNVYYSEVLEGASIPVPDGWGPANGARFIFDTLFISLMGEAEGNTSQVMVRRFLRDKEFEEKYEIERDADTIMSEDLVEMTNRGEINMDDNEDRNFYLSTSSITGRLEMIVDASPLFYFKSYIECEDAFYVVSYMAYIFNDEDFENMVYNWENYFCKFQPPEEEIFK